MTAPWVPLEPKLRPNTRGRKHFFALISRLVDAGCVGDTLERVRADAMQNAAPCGEDNRTLRVLASVLCDLRGKGWRFRIEDLAASTAPPADDGASVLEQKDRVRASLVLERNVQLRTPAVRAFVKGMEQRRLGRNGWSSVFSLMRDGRELAARLREVRGLPGPERGEQLRAVIDPYIQFVDADGVCEQSGMKLHEIWRYFRHTWATPYSNAPGRKFWILVRDRAVKFHPVIGIAAFGNAVVQLGPRDEWIGWTSKKFMERLRAEPSRDWAVWLQKSVAEMTEAVHFDDFVREKVVSKKEVADPSDDVIRRLDEYADAQRKQHDRTPQAELHKFDEETGEGDDWMDRARSHLFRAKRAEALGRVLQVRKALLKVGFDEPTKEKLQAVLNDAAGRRAVEIALRGVKATRIGINLLEITVCGAVAPYNALLGGKLVAMLLASPKVVREYERKYAKAESVIASSTAGRSVQRRPNLVALGTSSLYGVGSSMYNRISIPCGECGGRDGDMVRYENLGKSVGFGSIQFSAETINEIEAVIEATEGGRQINHIFGEGVSPRLRKVRAGMEAVGLPPDKLLMHGTPRIVYGVALAEQFREVLLGCRTNKPRYFLPVDDAQGVTRKIGDYWIKRWLANRIDQDEPLAEVERHTLVYPVEHGARVTLPVIEPEGPTLFNLLEGAV